MDRTETKSNPFSKNKSDMDAYVADGNSAVEFKLVRNVEDLDNSTGVFHPEMCHQIFGEGETIFGYEDLKIQLYLTAGSLKTCMAIKYSNKIPASLLTDGVDADNIKESMEKVVEPGYFVNLDLFTPCIEKEARSFRPLGELLHSFEKVWNVKSQTKLPNGNSKPSMTNGNGHDKPVETKTFEIYYCDINVPKFEDYHRKMEQFIMWYIDAASFIDGMDEKWKFYVMYEKYKTSEGQTCWAFVGYSTVYNFYSYPENIRPRVAQMIILPPFQRQGLAAELLSTVYQCYRADKRVTEITVEDPSDEFEVLRDFVDARDCLKLPAFSVEKLKGGYSTEMEDQARATLKLTKRQCKRIYEILKLRITNTENEEEFKKFRLDVKQRLNIPYKKQENDLKRMKLRQIDCEQLNQAALVDDATRKTELESNFQNVYAHYKVILNRLEKLACV